MSRRFERICFITDAPHFGGAERYVIDMCAAARRRSIHAHIHWIDPCPSTPPFFSPSHTRSKKKEAEGHRSRQSLAEVEARGRQEHLPSWCDTIKQHVGLSKQNGYAFREMRDALHRERPDAVIVNASGRPGMWRAPWACRSLGIPSAWVHHMIDPIDPRRLTARHMNGRMQGLGLWRIPQTIRHRLAAAGASAVITSNGDDAAHVRRWGLATASRTHVISPGIDPDRWITNSHDRAMSRRRWLPEVTDGAFVVGAATRLVDGKGIETLIDAIGLLADRHREISLLIAGTGPRADAFSKMVQERGLDSRIRFVGFVENMMDFYAVLDVFALCSTTESFGLALTEAMACECATLATPTHGALRQIRHRRSGIITRGFTSNSIAAGLSELCDNQQLREQLARQARRSALADFTIDRTLDATLKTLTRPRPVERTTDHTCPVETTAPTPEVFA